MRHASIRLAVILLAVLLTGCAGGDPIERWQTQVNHFIEEEHNGDVNGLRHYGEPAAQRSFSMIGASEGGIGLVAPERADTTGVILGRRTIGEHDWHIFLVGVIRFAGTFAWMPLEESVVEDIRLAAFHVEPGGEFVWRITEPNESQLAAYLAPQLAQWSQRFAHNEERLAMPRTIFPWEGDQFELEVDESAQTITAREKASGAVWELDLVEDDQHALALNPAARSIRAATVRER